MNREEAICIFVGMMEASQYCEPVDEAIKMAIEALKEQADLQELADSINDAYASGYNAAKREIAISMEYERAYQRGKADATKWIPVSKRLPEDNVPVNITWTNRNPVSYYADIKDKPFTATGVYFKGKWYWYSSTVTCFLAEYGKAEWDEIAEEIEVLAWMPLHEPYREDGEA